MSDADFCVAVAVAALGAASALRGGARIVRILSRAPWRETGECMDPTETDYVAGVDPAASPAAEFAYRIVVHQLRDGGKRYAFPNVQCRSAEAFRAVVDRLVLGKDPADRERAVAALELDAPTTAIRLEQCGGGRLPKTVHVLKDGTDARTARGPFPLPPGAAEALEALPPLSPEEPK